MNLRWDTPQSNRRDSPAYRERVAASHAARAHLRAVAGRALTGHDRDKLNRLSAELELMVASI